jgi:hypothetical protein
VLPENLRKSSEVSENDDFEFFELSKGFFVLASRKLVGEKIKKEALSELSNIIKEPEMKAELKEQKESKADFSFSILTDAEVSQKKQFFEEGIKKGDLVGVKSFDGKNYIASKKFFDFACKKIFKLNSNFALESAAKELNVSIDGLKVVLMILKDKGEVVEKKKNLFSLVK